MKKIISLKNIKFSSLNYKFAVYNGRMILTKQYRDFKKLLYISAHPLKNILPPYRIKIVMQTSLDIDNPIKCIIDALETKGILKDDKYVEELILIKKPMKRNENGSLDVWVGTIE